MSNLFEPNVMHDVIKSDHIEPTGKTVGLFITCVAETVHPQAADATAKLIERSGFTLHIPKQQTCCGQSAYNSGDDRSARRMLQRLIKQFEGCDYLVSPSASCLAHIKNSGHHLFDSYPNWHDRYKKISARSYDIVSFLQDVSNIRQYDMGSLLKVAYHDSCSSRFKLGIYSQVRELFHKVPKVSLVEFEEDTSCCGFGGSFSVKFPNISTSITDKKVAQIVHLKRKYNIDMLVGADIGCLMNISGRLQKLEINLPCFHLSELLTGMYRTQPAFATLA